MIAAAGEHDGGGECHSSLSNPSQSSKAFDPKRKGLIVVQISNALVRPIVPVIAAGLLIAMSCADALSNESNCRQLEDLARQYAGVQLTSQQQQIKRRLVGWYNDNCKRTRSVQARRWRSNSLSYH
jgi:hypothetical protein